MNNLILSILILVGSIAAAQPKSGVPTSSAELELADELDSDDTFLIRFEPHMLALKELTADIQILVSDKFSIGPTLGLMLEGDGLFYKNKIADRTYYNDRTNRQSYGLRTAYYFSGAQESSALVSLSGKYRKSIISIEPDPEEPMASTIFVARPTYGTAEFSETIYSLTGGYQWVWMDALNFTLSGGVSYFDTPTNVSMTYLDGTTYDYEFSSTEKFSYALDLTIGLKF